MRGSSNLKKIWNLVIIISQKYYIFNMLKNKFTICQKISPKKKTLAKDFGL